LAFSLWEKVPEGRMRGLLLTFDALSERNPRPCPLIRRFAPPSPHGRRKFSAFAAYYLLPTTYYLLPTTYYLLPTTYYLLPIA